MESFRAAVECVPRTGLPFFLAKCKSGGIVKVAYLGGSITAQEGWRVESLDRFRKRFPQTKFEEIYAAIGGTGSDFGAYRLAREVLHDKPDLLFVEFAENDGSIPSESVIPSMESIVRNTWAALPTCDICFVYVITAPKLKFLKEGKLYPTANLHEDVAEHYGIPSINFGVEVARLEQEGKLEMKKPKARLEQVAGAETDKAVGIPVNPDGKIPFSADGIHPYRDTGHKLYVEALFRSLPLITAASGPPSLQRKLPDPLSQDDVKNVSFLDVGQTRKAGCWTRLEKPWKLLRPNPGVWVPEKDLTRFTPSLWLAEPGAECSFEFSGSGFCLYTLSGPGCGSFEIEVDGVKHTHCCFDPYSRGWRINPFFAARALDRQIQHHVTLRVLSEPPDKKAILAKVGGADLIEKMPEAFQPINLVIGGVLIED